MNRKTVYVFIVLSLCIHGATGANYLFAEDVAKSASNISSKAPTQDRRQEGPKVNFAVTHHVLEINHKMLNYTATAGYMPIQNKSGEHVADMFFIAYVKEPIQEQSLRPITFAFNGGPGAASVWLHLGAIGPKRVLISNASKPLSPPYELVDNENGWLDLTDLVFIDPVGTGYSRPAPGKDPKQFYGVKGDIESVGEFIRLYTTKFKRWRSPKFVVGESYGTVRGVLLAQYLHESYGMDVNGLLLISSVLNFQTFIFDPGNDLPYAMFLPSYAATAFYHKTSSVGERTNFQSTLEEVEKWALGEYMPALAKGDTLADTERNGIIKKLARYTGLSQDYIKNKNLRITKRDFSRELLRSENRTIGILDSRVTGLDKSGGTFSDDPSMVATLGAYIATLNDYVRTELKYENDLPYEYLSAEANQSWNWGSAIGGYPSVIDELREEISETGYLKVFMASGYFDLDAPYFATKYNVSHLGLKLSLRKNITLAFYEAGHQMYTDISSLEKLRADVSTFINSTLCRSLPE
jgi:carboxypeptidase C (cathepsin A)